VKNLRDNTPPTAAETARWRVILWIIGLVVVIFVVSAISSNMHGSPSSAGAIASATDAPATDAPTDPPTAAPTMSAEDLSKARAYWGGVIDVYSDALSDGVSAYDEGNDREAAANYLENCATNADTAKSHAELDALPDGWDDVRSALIDGLSDLKSRCTQEKMDLYGGSNKTTEELAHDAAKVPPRMLEALHLARVHIVAGGGNPSDLKAPGNR